MHWKQLQNNITKWLEMETELHWKQLQNNFNIWKLGTSLVLKSLHRYLIFLNQAGFTKQKWKPSDWKWKLNCIGNRNRDKIRNDFEKYYSSYLCLFIYEECFKSFALLSHSPHVVTLWHQTCVHMLPKIFRTRM